MRDRARARVSCGGWHTTAGQQHLCFTSYFAPAAQEEHAGGSVRLDHDQHDSQLEFITVQLQCHWQLH